MRSSSRVVRLLPWLFAASLSVGACKSPPTTSAPQTSSTEVLASAKEVAPIADDLPEVPRDPREEVLAEAAMVLLTKQHVLTRPIDDTLSKEAFPKYIDAIDGPKLLLLESDVAELSKYSDRMDDELRAGDLVLARKGAALVNARRKIVAKVIADLTAKPFDFTQKEEIETDPEKRTFCKSEDELRDRWRGVLKLQILERVQQMEELLEAKNKKDAKPLDAAAEKALGAIPATPVAREEKARKEVGTSYETRFVRLQTSEALDPTETFINAINAVYDPHTLYLAPSEKANFDIAITGTLEGIGAALGEQEHYVIVRELIPGGASWQQGKLEAGDLILAVAQQGKDAVDVTDMPIDKVVSMIRGPKGTVVILTVKKPDGRVETISITRDVIKIEATYARGALLHLDKKSSEVGYIYLPGFYGDIGGASKSKERNATDDVRLLLQAFQKKKITNVIVDIRGNGGGLLSHARDISGLFVDKAPVVQTRDSDGTVEVLTDEDPSVAFSGNVVVMVDRFSASAAEILAGALQDYERAVIVGTGPTHGKGSVQAVVDLDRQMGNKGDPLGVFKITMQQYFRVNGASTQLKGVVPDIILPDPASYVESGERTLFHPLPWSSVKPVAFPRQPHTWSVSTLDAASKDRVKAQPLFGKVETFGKLLQSRRDQTREPLEQKEWIAKRKRDKEALDAASPNLKESKPLLEVAMLENATPSPIDADKNVKKKLDAWKDELARDPWVAESLHVLDDMSKKR